MRSFYCSSGFVVLVCAGPAQTGAAGSTAAILIGCEQAQQRIQVTTSSQLDPSCDYTQGLDIVASGVELDCRGARIVDAEGDGSRGILVTAPADTALSDIVIRNCVVEGFLNNIRISRSGFKTLEAGEEYEDAFSNIVIEDSQLFSSRGSGVFVDGYVTGVTLRNLEVVGSGSVGVYLEAGSMDNRVESCMLEDNGYADVDPDGTPYDLPSGTVYYLSTGREAIAIDGSRNNVIEGNEIVGASAGGIFLYKNCGEYATLEPESWWERRYGAEGNLIIGNTIRDVESGVWIGSRMAQNQRFMDCSDPAYISYPLVRIHLDYAAGNEVSGNTFENVTYGVRIEDDDANVEGNTFAGSDKDSLAIVLGTMFRTRALDQPVRGASIVNNQVFNLDNRAPFRVIHQSEETVFSGNLINGRRALLLPGPHPPMDLHLFVDEVWYVPGVD